MTRLLVLIRHSIMDLARALMWNVGKYLPIDDKKIVISCFKGRGYCDNPKYIVEALLKKDSSLNIIWLVSNKTEALSLPKCVKTCYYNRLAAIFHYSTARVWIDNVRKDEKFIKKEAQFYLQTWHGGGAIKRIEKDVEEKLSKNYVEKAKKESKYIDLFASEGHFYSELYHKSFWYSGRVAEIGLPRYDFVLNHYNDEELKNKIHDYYGIPHDKKIILYAPTFRSGYRFEPYDIDHHKLLEACKERFGCEFVSFVHLHPNVANKFSELKYDGNTIINATYYPDMQELVAGSDILISDYSSVIVDFALSNKPAFVFAIDINDYESDRGSYFDFRTGYPFPIAESNEELMEVVHFFDEEKYKQNLEEYFKKIGLIKNSKSSEKYAELLLDYMNHKDKKLLFDSYQGIMK